MNKFQGHRNSIRKYVHGWLSVAEMVRWYNDHEMTICPCCRGRERQDHILRCPDAKAEEYRKECFQEFWDQLEKITEPRMLVALKEYVRRWIQYPQYEAPPVNETLVHAAMQAQSQIGWTNFTRGKISKKFISHQWRHLPIKRRTTLA